MEVSLFDYDLPAELVAQYPAENRTAARLLVLDRRKGGMRHGNVGDLPGFLDAGDLLVVNETKVFPARLLGRRVPSGGSVECLLLGRVDRERWEALMHPGQKLRPGTRVVFEKGSDRLEGEVLERRLHGRRIVRLWSEASPDTEPVIDRVGHIPLPPYIRRPATDFDRERYQTVYARVRGSVAAPTAGLHLTDGLFDALEKKGVGRTSITLHVGYGTFEPVRSELVEDHLVEAEWFEVGEAAAGEINAAVRRGRRVVAVGTTTTRALETAAMSDGTVEARSGMTDLFIRPGHEFRVVGAMLTNFHLPRSSLLMLVAAFGGHQRVLAAYAEAVRLGYRFYSYGDAMLVL
ncbi:MAG: tRNA preQ1(34) S-adenosylmethionine ribosyltransferase-isomerase QueA [Vicinamibacterales bacterium]